MPCKFYLLGNKFCSKKICSNILFRFYQNLTWRTIYFYRKYSHHLDDSNPKYNFRQQNEKIYLFVNWSNVQFFLISSLIHYPISNGKRSSEVSKVIFNIWSWFDPDDPIWPLFQEHSTKWSITSLSIVVSLQKSFTQKVIYINPVTHVTKRGIFGTFDLSQGS